MSTEESWLVTPPPCFTAGVSSSVEVGSMENLLIEHPSMSVYGPRGRQGSSGVESDHDDSMSDTEESPAPPTTVARPLRRSGRALTLRATLSPQRLANKGAQLAKRKARRHDNRSQLNRINKLPCSNPKRKNHNLHQPSCRTQPSGNRRH